MAHDAYEIHLAPRTWGANEPWLTIPVAVTFKKAEWAGRYRVVLKATGQEIGYVTRTDQGWDSGICNSAYYPAGSDIMTTTETHWNHRAGSWAKLEVVEGHATRTDAVNEILWQLGRRAAASVEPMIHEARLPFITAQAEAGEDWAIRYLTETQEV